MIADTSALLALFNRREPQHQAVRDAYEANNALLIVSPFVIAELDYLLLTRMGVPAELRGLRELASRAYEHAAFTDADIASCADIVERYSDQAIGVTDASLVVLAERYRTTQILTLDHRHFSVLKPLAGGHFHVLP